MLPSFSSHIADFAAGRDSKIGSPCVHCNGDRQRGTSAPWNRAGNASAQTHSALKPYVNRQLRNPSGSEMRSSPVAASKFTSSPRPPHGLVFFELGTLCRVPSNKREAQRGAIGKQGGGGITAPRRIATSDRLARRVRLSAGSAT